MKNHKQNKTKKKIHKKRKTGTENNKKKQDKEIET